jgi:hypothetical protein
MNSPSAALAFEAQRQRNRSYCEMKGLPLMTNFEDPDLSGGKSLGSNGQVIVCTNAGGLA